MTNTHAHELPIPPLAATDSNGRELLRIWAAQGKVHVSLATGLWEDPACWGILLVDLVKHVANAYVQSDGKDLADVVNRIKEGFDAEWTVATDEPRGALFQNDESG